MRLQERLEDDERLDGLLEALERRGSPEAKQGLGKKLKTAAGARAIPGQLNAIKEKLQIVEDRLLSRAAAAVKAH